MSAIIQAEDPDQPDVLAMLAEADAWYNSVYPPEHNHLLDIATLKRPGVSFHAARIDGRLKGCGAVVRHDAGFGEIKRMYVDPVARRLGLGRLMLEALEDHARRAGLALIRLETGIRQPDALALYRSAGYRETGPFVPYVPGPFSLFFEKRLEG